MPGAGVQSPRGGTASCCSNMKHACPILQLHRAAHKQPLPVALLRRMHMSLYLNYIRWEFPVFELGIELALANGERQHEVMATSMKVE